MNELQIFKNHEFGQIRTLTINGAPWFVGKDIAASLGYGEGKSLSNAVANHVDPEDKGVTEMMTPGGRQKVVIINESGLYSLVLSSKGTVPTTAIAKDYGMSAKALNQKLHELRVIYRMGSQWFLYAKYQAKGYTHSKTFDFKHSDGRPDCKMQTEWTQKGRLFLYQLLKKHGVLPMIEREDQEAGH